MSYSNFPPSSYFQQNPVENPYYYYAPTLVQYYDIIKTIVLVEFSILILGLVLTLFFKFFLDYREKKIQSRKEEYRKTLFDAVHSKEPFSLERTRGLKKLSLLIPTMESIDSLIVDEKWSQIKEHISQKILLPAARSWAQSKSWIKRAKAARCFSFHPTLQDQNTILKLVDDSVPIIQYTAIFSAIKLGTAESAEAIIAAMSKASRFARFPLRDALRRCDAKTFAFLEKKLTEPISAYDKVSCLEAVDGRVYHDISKALENNLFDPHKNLRLAAIRVLGNYHTQSVVQRLIQLLDHAEWEVRAVTAGVLGTEGQVAAIPKLAERLSDKVWWVRMNAAEALKKIGPEGVKALEMQDPDIDKFAYEISRFVLSNG